MKILTVVPIARGVGKETLSYFTSRAIAPGMIVKIPLRSRIVPALILASENIEDVKSDIRTRGYRLKKISPAPARQVLTSEFIAAARVTAEFFASSLGSILTQTVPQAVYRMGISLRMRNMPRVSEKTSPRTEIDKSILQTDTKERITHYRNLIREEFVRNKSVFLMVPTLHHAAGLGEMLQKGIEQYTFVFHGAHRDNELMRLWRAAGEMKHPVLVVGLGTFLGIPRRDIGAVIVEEEQSGVYQQIRRPFLDLRVHAENVAEMIGARFILGDTLLSVETIFRHEQHEFSECAPLTFRSVASVRQEIVDMRPYRAARGGEGIVLSDELKTLITRARRDRESLFIFTSRRGHASVVVCGDCDTVARCNRCEATLSLHEGEPYRVFVCHRCGHSRSADERCSVCQSWKLTALGIGISRVIDEIKNYDRESVIFHIDSDSVKNYKEGYAVIRKWTTTPGSILVGTVMALPYIDDTVDLVAVASLDHLFAIPDFRANEKIMRLLLGLRELTGDTLMIQTRHGDRTLLERAFRGNLTDFFRSELAIRKEFFYPPFSVLVRISRMIAGGDRGERVFSDLRRLADIFARYRPVLYEGRDGRTAHLLLKISRQEWKGSELACSIRELPLHYVVGVNPARLF